MEDKRCVFPALAILTFATALTAVPARAQMYDPAYPVCLHVYNRGATITNAATRRCLSAARRHRAGLHSASSIHILRARKSLRVIGGIAASTQTCRRNERMYLVAAARRLRNCRRGSSRSFGKRSPDAPSRRGDPELHGTEPSSIRRKTAAPLRPFISHFRAIA
jgi:hypothetical protein